MNSQEIPIGNKTSFNVTLTQETIGLDEVVAVGYGTVRKKDLTGSVASVGSSKLAERATFSAAQAMQGKAAGVVVQQTNSAPGADAKVMIRGNRSLKATNEPLYVVDGVPLVVGLSEISQSDIESMDILKDASATAIYGSRGANGVVIITTKKGKKGNFNVSYNNYFGVASPVRLFDLLGASDFVTIANEKRSNRGQTAIAVGTDVNTDWQKAVLRQNAFQQDHNLSISGANDKTNYYFSLGYTTQEGVTRPNEMSRYTFRSNIDQKVKKWLSIGMNSSISRSEYHGLNTGTKSLSGNIFNAIRQLPNTALIEANDPTGDEHR